MRSNICLVFRLAVALAIAAAPAGCRKVASTKAARPEAVAMASTANANEVFSLYELPAVWRDQQGDTLHLSVLAGRVRVVAMVYTNCHATCPLIIADLKRIEAELKDSQRNDVGFVLVSLDPSRDTPARLAEWATSIGLNAAHWTLLSGTDGAVRELAVALNVRYQPQQQDGLAHTNGLTVLDRRGNIVHQQNGLGETAETIGVMKTLLR